MTILNQVALRLIWVITVSLIFSSTAAADMRKERFWHDGKSKEYWQSKKDNGPYLREQARLCDEEKSRLEKEREKATKYLNDRDRAFGGYLPTVVVMREGRRMLLEAEQGFSDIQQIKYNLGSYRNPGAVCRATASFRIKNIKKMIEEYP